MARALKGRSKIWVRPFASSLTCKELSKKEEEADVYIDDQEIEDDGNKSAQNILENIQERANEVSENFECDTKLQEEYKKLLVRAVVERIKRKMPEKEMWEEIEKETGFNHRIVWQGMRKAIIQKIMRLLPANDLLKDIPTEMQLSPSDWLCFDLILVHEQIDVINNDSLTKTPDQCSQRSAKSKNEEPQCLQELFELVKHYDIENLVGEALMAAWTSLTSQYNSRGRYCSPMMLQLRWYQMKKYTRSRFYDTYAHNTNQDIQKTLDINVSSDLTVLQLEIAVLYNKIITQEYPSWETLINEKRVILFNEFSSKSLHDENKTNSSQAIPPTPETSNEPPPVLLIKLNENQLEDFDKIKNAEGTTITDHMIVIDLKNDEEYITELQKVMAKSIESGKQVEVNDLDVNEEFKLRIVRELAKMDLKDDKKFNKLTWQRLNREMGRDCKEILNQMRNVIVEKLICLLVANDVTQNVAPEMRLAESDWLFFDYILVHEKIYSVNVDLLETKCLRDLVNLVVAYKVEELSGEELVEAWLNLTLNYNRGGRQCSPMLLQLRWRQLKEFARTHVYKQSAILNRYKNKMLIAIATKYQKIITQQFASWYALVKQKIVILPDEFIRILNQKGKWKEVEPREGWYLHVKEGIYSSKETSFTSDNISYFVYDLTQTVEQTPEVSRNQVTITKINEMKEPEIIELDSDDEINEILRERADKISNISQEKVNSIMNISETQLECDNVNKNVIVGDKRKNLADVDQVVPKPVTPSISNDEPILCDSDDEMDKLLQEKANLMSIELPENFKDLDTIGDEVDEFKKVNKSKVNRMEVEEVDIIKEMGKNYNQNEALDDADFDENNIEFVDDGIQIEEGNEYKRTETKSTTDSSSDSDDDSDTDESEDEPQIDVKLLMDTKVSTKRIDGMEVFKFIDYESIRDKRLIEHLEAENKPVRKQAPNTVDIESCKEVNSGCDIESLQSDDDTQISFQEKIKYTSWLLQKPKKRKYTSSQLTKNPDFNTQLKTLTPGFLSSTRNRELLNECQPLTIDLHKTFENKLVNGTMYLQRSNFKSHNIRENQRIPDMLTEDQNTKLAGHIRDLIATMTADSQNESDLMTSVTPTLPIRRSKVINLPDKDQIRLINQNLLTAEITPRHQPLLSIPANDTGDDDSDIEIIGSEDSPNKRLKTNSNSEPSSSNGSSLYCCWAREKIASMDENLDYRHMCPKNCCTCCCRLDLATNLTSSNPSLQTPNTSSSNISNPSNVDNNNSNRINNSVNTEIISPKLTDNMETIITMSNQSRITYGNKSLLKINVKNAAIGNANTAVKKRDRKGVTSLAKVPKKTKVLNYTIDYNNYIVRKKACVKQKVPLPVVKPSTSNEDTGCIKTMAPLIKIAPRLPDKSLQKQETPTYVILPPGVNFVTLADQDIALAINPGVHLEPAELQSLMSVCASMNASQKKQSNKVSSVPPLLKNG